MKPIENRTTPDEPASLRERLTAYRPVAVPAAVWEDVRDEAITLVLRADEPDDERARKDLGALAAAAAYLAINGVPVSLDALVADATLAGLDTQRAASFAGGTRENLRGRLRRMQAVHNGVPWCAARRPDGARAATFSTFDDVARALTLLPEDARSGTTGAGAVQAAVDSARARRLDPRSAEVSAAVWAEARRYASKYEVALTRRGLAALATYEALGQDRPLVDLIEDHHLTRRDLELALTQANATSEQFDAEQVTRLRG